MPRRWIPLLLALLLLLPAAYADDTVREPLPLAFFQQTANEETAPDQPYVKIIPFENPIRMSRFGDEDHWKCDFNLKEIHGIPFTITMIQEILYDAEGGVQDFRYYTQEDMEHWSGSYSLELKDGEVFQYGGGFSDWPELAWAGYLIEGVDESGASYSFHCLFELLHEYNPVWTVEEFQSQSEQEGIASASVSLSPEPDVYLTELEPNGGEWVWQYTPTIENTGDTAFTLLGMDYVNFNGDEMSFGRSYSLELVAELFEMDTLTVNPGERYSFSEYTPLGDYTMTAIRLRVADQNGTEMSFVCSIHLIPERADHVSAHE